MGSRGNIVMRDEGDVWFYTHWRGPETHKVVQDALNKFGDSRWQDGPYLGRIVFCELCSGQGETGYGITHELTDYTYPTVVVNILTQEVEIHKNAAANEKPTRKWNFAEYVKLDLPDHIDDLLETSNK